MVDVQCGATLLRLLNVYLEPQQVTKRQQHVQALVTFVREVYTPTSVLMGTFDTAADRPASKQALPMLMAELGERCRAMPEPGEHAATAMHQAHPVHALVGSGLQPLDTRTAEVHQPLCAYPPLMLRLRWALPLLTRQGQHH
jgi:hypothetical protein